MNITVKRKWFSDKSCIGEMSIDGVFQCFTLERTEDDTGHDAIPVGTYGVRMTFSPRFKQAMPVLIGVPGRSEIRIHWGNDPDDTEGCLLVGTTRGVDFIGHSRDAFNEFMLALRNGMVGADPHVFITIEDAE